MGKDRAFRSYFFMHSHGMILVERPNVDEVIESCAEPTPIAVIVKNYFYNKLRIFRVPMLRTKTSLTRSEFAASVVRVGRVVIVQCIAGGVGHRVHKMERRIRHNFTIT